MRISLISVGLAAALSLAAATAQPPLQKYEPTSNYRRQNMRGWTVYVNHRLLEDKKSLGDRTLEQLSVKLYEINRAVPGVALEKLHQIPIWVEYLHPKHACACYHPNKEWLIAHDFNPEKAGAVEISNAAMFLDWIRTQPSMVLHELAHGYHHRFLPGSYDNPAISAEYRRAKESGSYESVLHGNADKKQAYALDNPQEYFAELTEAWFGTNDIYPFVRAEVIQHDPKGAELLKKLWGG